MAYTALQLADAYLQTGEFDLALHALDQHLAAQPADDEARRLRAKIRARQPDHRAAALADLDALAAPTAWDSKTRGEVCEALGAIDAAESAYATAAHHGSSISLWETYLRFLIRIGKTEHALSVIPDFEPRWVWLRWRGEILTLLDEPERAVEQFDLALDDFDHHPPRDGWDYYMLWSYKAPMLMGRAALRRQLGRYADADADYLAALPITNEPLIVTFNRGLVILESGGELADAAAICRDAFYAAPPRLRDAMRAELEADPRYAALLEELN